MADKYADKADEARKQRLAENKRTQSQFERIKYDARKRKSCTRKKKYLSKSDAQYKLPEIQKVYKCPHCEGYHRATRKEHKYNSLRRRGERGIAR